MAFIIVLLTLAMVLDSAVLILLVLIQLPKKEAGGVLAFGGSEANALFGAGTGTMLTKITKYAAAGFFVLAIILSIMQNLYHNRHISAFEGNLGKSRQQAPGAMPPATTPSTPAPSSTPNTLSTSNAFPLLTTSNAAPSLVPMESTNTPTSTNTTPITPPK